MSSSKKMAKKAYYRYNKFEERVLGRCIINNSKHKAPDFMIIGVAKAGTTSLYQYLAQHPKITLPEFKEVKYFENKNKNKGLRWYLKNFPLKQETGDKLAFEASPTYLYMKQSPRRLAHLFPEMKFIAVLRDPVKRSFSHWNSYHDPSLPGSGRIREKYYDSRSFKKAVEEELNGNQKIRDAHLYLYKSYYARHLRHWYKFYSPENILLLDFEKLKSNPKLSLKKVTNFLGIENIYTEFEETEEKLKGDLYKKDQGSNQQIKHYNTTPYKEKMSAEMKTELSELFQPYDAELKKLTGRQFSWMK